MSHHQESPEAELAALEAERLLASAVHDLRSPLLIIQGFAAGLEPAARQGDWPRFAGDMERIVRTCGHMQQLLHELTDFVRSGQVQYHMQPVPFQNIWHHACELLAVQMAEAGVLMTTPDDWPRVLGDETALVRVVQNLLENALRHRRDDEPLQIRLTIDLSETVVTIAIEDNGSGIEPDRIPELFQPFRQLTGRTGSVGLGLAIARRIVDGHGGQLALTSSGSGSGTTAIFTLPLANDGL
ncbi:GHKL domain-containing protein [bacterium]|nr:GHKL domain-containing protein [bacterium]